MDWLQLIYLSLIQGLTEFLPISSSAHLVLPSQLTQWPDQGLAFDVGVHFGTLLAVIAYFREDLLAMIEHLARYPATRLYNDDIDLVLKLALATLPIVLVGFLSKGFIENNLRTVPVIACATLVFAVALWFADHRVGTKERPSWSNAGLIGLAQVLALVPGTSRSGITITAALLIGLSRVAAARFSFLLAIPTIAGAQLLLTIDLVSTDSPLAWVDLIIGAVLAGGAAYLSIHYFIALIDRIGMMPFVLYRLALGIVLLAIYYAP